MMSTKKEREKKEIGLQHAPSTHHKAETLYTIKKFCASKRFGEDVGRVGDPRSVDDGDRAGLDMGANEVVADVDVFGLAVGRVVFGQRASTFVVSGDDEGGWGGYVEL